MTALAMAGDVALARQADIPAPSAASAPADQDRMTPQDPGAASASRWRIQRRAELEFEQQRNFRLDRDDPKRRSDVEPLLRLGLTYRANRHLLGFVETEALIDQRDERGRPSRTDGRLRLNQAYLALDEWIDDSEIRIGRWLYRDEREWLFDESLDGVLARYDRGKIEVDALAGRVNLWRRDLFDSGTRGDPVNVYGLLARYEIRKAFEIGAYAVVRHDTAGLAGRHRHMGLRAHGRLGNWLHWTEVGIVRGNDGRQRLNGHGFDIGGVYTVAEQPFRPRLLVGYAYGSGDDDPDDGVDRRFRQTGMQSNEARLGGLFKRRIYGEAFDPELSNLHIVSLGVGIAPTPRWSIDLVWHGYRQAKTAEVEHAEIEPRRDSLGRHALGQELNLVVGHAPSESVIVGAVLGWFRPSGRFDADRNGRAHNPGQAVFARLELKVRF